jgi:phage baseplate assembly protein V
MHNGLIDSAAQAEVPEEKYIYGMALAHVIDNIDEANLGRVQVRLPWLKGYEPWAHVAVPMAGRNRGIYFMPQVGDEVVVGFNHGDVSEPFVIGSVWNGQDDPPAKGIHDPVDKRVIRTPKGHQVIFDDAKETITIKHAKDGQVEFTSDQIELKIGSASIRIQKKEGDITIKTNGKLTLDAKTIDITAKTKLTLSGKQSVEVQGGSSCKIDATSISIG